MISTISTAAFDRLMQLGRSGGLEIDDIRHALPVDTMTVEELADVLARLEQAGISVEIDPALLTPRHQKRAVNAIKPATDPLPHNETATTAHARLANLASSIKAASENAHRAPTVKYTESSTTIFVIVIALFVFILALWIWQWA